MTHSGGKPHAVGDKGQRYEISYYDEEANERKVFGWTDDIAWATEAATNLELRPSWHFAQVRDRLAKLEE